MEVTTVTVGPQEDRAPALSVAHVSGMDKEYVEAPPGFEPGVEVLQTSALPLGDGADRKRVLGPREHRIVPDAPQPIKDASPG